MIKLTILSSMLIVMLSLHAQTIEGDALFNFIGTKVDAPATQKFFSLYEIKKSDDGYSSEKYGINITVENDSLTMMTFYRQNTFYGRYTHKLPKGIAFGNNSNDVIKKLGNPTTSHIAVGFLEYEYGIRKLVCYFDKKVLDQVIITMK